MGEIISLAVKDLRVLVRDRSGFFFTFFFPLLYAIFFGTVFSGAGGGDDSALEVLIVDEDGSEHSRGFFARLQEAPEVDVTPSDREAAVDEVRRGRSVAYVVLPEGIGAEWSNLFQGKLAIELGADPRRQAEAGLLAGVLTKYAAERFEATFGGGGGFEPLSIREEAITVERRGPNNAYAISFPQGIIWGIMGSAAAFGIGLVIERTRGTLVRLRMAPIHRAQILGGKALACFTTTVLMCTFLWAIAIVVFGVRPNSLPLLGLAIVCASLGFVGIMMLLSVLGRTEQSAGGIGWAALLVMAMIGGGMIPLFVMPSWLQRISDVSPVKWSILAMEGAVWRRFSFDEMLLPCGILLAVGMVAFFVGVRAFQWMERG